MGEKDIPWLKGEFRVVQAEARRYLRHLCKLVDDLDGQTFDGLRAIEEAFRLLQQFDDLREVARAAHARAAQLRELIALKRHIAALGADRERIGPSRSRKFVVRALGTQVAGGKL